MNRTNVLRRNVLLAGTFAFAVFSGAPAWAASITLSNSNCASYDVDRSGAQPGADLRDVDSADLAGRADRLFAFREPVGLGGRRRLGRAHRVLFGRRRPDEL